MLRNLNISSNGRRDSSDGRVGVLASEIPTGFPLPAFLLNDIDSGAAGRLYSLEILTLPSAGVLYLDKRGVGSFSGAPDGTYTGTQRVRKFDPGVGLVSTADGTYSLTVGTAPVATVTGVTVSPATATGSTTFSATVQGTNSPSQSVTWSASAGSITSGGVFTAPAATGSVQSITITATSVLDNTKSGTATVTIAAASATVTSVVVSPSSVSMNGGATQQFNSTVNGSNSPPQTVTWSASIGSITSSGLYTAPAATQGAQTATITATSTFNTQRSGTASVTIAALPVDPEIPEVQELLALAPSVIKRTSSSEALRLILNFIDTPAPPERTIVLGGRSRTITAG